MTRNNKTGSLFSLDYRSSFYPSTLGFKYPTLRDHPLQSGKLWLLGKRIDDGAEGLWRIHDGLYNFNDFIKQHPGGADWLMLTQCTDITEAFEAHHISRVPERMLSEFFVRKASTPRNSPFTFKENGFYRTLKRNIRGVLKDVPYWPRKRSKIITDLLFIFYLVLGLLSTYLKSYILGALAGFFLSCTVTAAHNFFHQKDNFRMYYFDFSMMGSRSWRISHVLSHHMYPNTIRDMEMSIFEPLLQYLPQQKSIFVRYSSWFYSFIIYGLIFVGNWLIELIYCIWRKKGFSQIQLLPFTVPLGMYLITGHTLLFILQMFAWINWTGSLYFGIISVNGSHHHPDIFHDGDTPRPKQELDWGIHQLDAVMDRKEVAGSPVLVLTNFGHHGLHHLFPTLDHGILEYLYPIVLKTCKQFGIQLKSASHLDMMWGQFILLANTQPTLTPPKPLNRKVSNQDDLTGFR